MHRRINERVNSLPEGTSTAAHIKVGDIVVGDDAIGTNVLSLTGPDAAFFEIVGKELFLKAGTHLDFETKPTYQVAVAVNDATADGSHGGTSSTYTLNVSDVTPETITG